MKTLLLICLTAMSFKSHTPPPNEVTLKLTIEEVQLVLGSIENTLPMKTGNPLTNKIIMQVQPQINDTTKPKK